MYPPPYYTDNAPAFTAGVMREHSFAVMTMVGDNGLCATHLPFVLKDEGTHGTLYGHIAKSNPKAKLLDGRREAMVVFSGPNAYISASWYDHPDRQVPTWNYISVQASGRPVALEAQNYMSEMAVLVEQYETENAWSIDDAQDYAARIMAGIVYFKMPIDTVQGFRKISSNKPKSEREIIAAQLENNNEHAMADAMRQLNA
ncbi:FMN-binding negative transcriptional regulator [Fretibacter rubidus]|uniref:FMN-binding negative transcriptional regulator n=1 Tax=Fretibacter rubidus TaxID=570162 RepID=UPI00352B64E6